MNSAMILILAVFLGFADKQGLDKPVPEPETQETHEVHGGPGNDTIKGTAGPDALFGDPGADVFLIQLSSTAIDTLKDFNPAEGDQIVLFFGDTAKTRKKLKIPKHLDLGNFQIDYKGNLNIMLNNNTWLPFLKMNRSDLNMKVEDKSNKVRLIFKKSF